MFWALEARISSFYWAELLKKSRNNRAIGKVGQNRDNQGLSEYSIANNYATTIYFTDAVKPVAGAVIEQAAA